MEITIERTMSRYEKAIRELERFIDSYSDQWGGPPVDEVQRRRAEVCRQGLTLLIEQGFDGNVSLGPLRDITKEGRIAYAHQYQFRDGRVYGNFPTEKKVLGFRKWETTNVTPDSIPFELYSPGYLEFLEGRIGKTVEKKFSTLNPT